MIAILPLAVVIGLVLLGLIAAGRRSGRAPTLVLRKFKINTANDGNPCIEISGRPSGIIAWLLTVMQLDTQTTLTVTDLHVSLKSASLSGEFSNFIPMPHVSSTHCGYTKPIICVFLAAVTALLGIVVGSNQRDGGPIIVGGLILSAIFIGAYYVSKKIKITIRTDGAWETSIVFRPSVIEGVPVNIASTIQAIAILNEKVLAAA